MQFGKRNYSDADMMRMQREAEERVREMHSRARQTQPPEQEVPASAPNRQQNRGWASNSGYNRGRNYYRHRQPEPEPPPPPPPPEPEPEPPPPEPEKKPTTVVEDIMAALNMDEDYLLIIGMLLILINQRADTTLILALAYLLI